MLLYLNSDGLGERKGSTQRTDYLEEQKGSI
jgi:hypothetical protein